MRAARWSGVQPRLRSCWFTSAPRSSTRNFTISSCVESHRSKLRCETCTQQDRAVAGTCLAVVHCKVESRACAPVQGGEPPV